MLNSHSNISKRGNVGNGREGADVEEMWAIIDKLKRENEHLKLQGSKPGEIRSNLSSLDRLTRRGRKR